MRPLFEVVSELIVSIEPECDGCDQDPWRAPVHYGSCPLATAQVCEWFARCTNEATHNEPHPVLGSVPACDRCPQIGR